MHTDAPIVIWTKAGSFYSRYSGFWFSILYIKYMCECLCMYTIENQKAWIFTIPTHIYCIYYTLCICAYTYIHTYILYTHICTYIKCTYIKSSGKNIQHNSLLKLSKKKSYLTHSRVERFSTLYRLATLY